MRVRPPCPTVGATQPIRGASSAAARRWSPRSAQRDFVPLRAPRSTMSRRTEPTRPTPRSRLRQSVQGGSACTAAMPDSSRGAGSRTARLPWPPPCEELVSTQPRTGSPRPLHRTNPNVVNLIGSLRTPRPLRPEWPRRQRGRSALDVSNVRAGGTRRASDATPPVPTGQGPTDRRGWRNVDRSCQATVPNAAQRTHTRQLRRPMPEGRNSAPSLRRCSPPLAAARDPSPPPPRTC